MNYEDTLTLNAFLAAIARLQKPLPEGLLRQLDEIEQNLPRSVYKLHKLAKQFEPLHREYIAALRDQPSEGERLKFSAADTFSEVDQLLLQLRYQIALLRDDELDEAEMTDEELRQWQDSPEAELAEQQWMESFANSQDVLAQLADEALEEFRQGRTQPLNL